MDELKGFRMLLVAGAVIFAGLGLLGWLSPNALRAVLGLDIERDVPGFVAMSRLYGGLSLSAGLGYAIAARDPLRQRGLLAVLFAVPILVVLAAIVGVAGQQYSAWQGSVFAVVNLAYALLYFRLYPRPSPAS